MIPTFPDNQPDIFTTNPTKPHDPTSRHFTPLGVNVGRVGIRDRNVVSGVEKKPGSLDDPHRRLVSGVRVVIGAVRARGHAGDLELAAFLESLVTRSEMHLAGMGPVELAPDLFDQEVSDATRGAGRAAGVGRKPEP